LNISKLSDEYYLDLCNDLLPILHARFYHHHSDNDKINPSLKQYEDGYRAEFSCPYCSKSQIRDFEAKELSIYVEHTHEFTCSGCGFYGGVFLIPLYVALIEEKLKKLLQSDSCAIWPVSRHFATVYESSQVLKNLKQKYLLINNKKSLEGKSFFGREIHSPDCLLSNSEVDTAIIFSQSYDEILTAIQRDYPHINPILFHEIGFME
jgi:predicted RNA-binding Zn-ribbon protein involved in translation (DUF1610 family)